FAIYLGVLLSLILFLAKTSTPEILTISVDEDDSERRLVETDQKQLRQCPQLKIIRINRSVYFGSINHIRNRIAEISDNEGIYNILIIATGINLIDLAGAEALIAENKRLKHMNGGLYFVNMKTSVYKFAAESGIIQDIGPDHFFNHKRDALAAIRKNMDSNTCASCQIRLFLECR
ncbi:MAG: sodium-independent anion transporter, partial [Candidatus Electrothrix sp. LOE2]|nr:sodium-independent anion transporter [Candidatus Electrothrix sp. LOE2]